MSEDLYHRIELVLRELDTYAACGAVYHDISGRRAPETGRAFCRLCARCVRHSRAGDFCRQAATAGAYQSLLRGTVYEFRCWLGLTALVLPIVPRGKEILGAIEIGGLLRSGELQLRQHGMLATLSAIDPENRLPRSVSIFQGIGELPEIDLANLAEFFREAMFSSGLIDDERFLANRGVWEQQRRLAKGIAELDSERGNQRHKLLEITESLLLALHGNDESVLQRRTDKLLSLILLLGEKDSSLVRARLLPVLAFLAEAAILEGEEWSRYITVYSRWHEELGQIEELAEQCIWFERLIKRLARGYSGSIFRENLSDAVLLYLHRHFAEDLRLADLAKAVGASSSSVMHKLKSETGKTFSQQLNDIRIKEAKRLLAFTSLPLGEISMRCGFRDQSYFSKVFLRCINLTPREFRRMLMAEEDPCR